jgi:hypothetical protein
MTYSVTNNTEAAIAMAFAEANADSVKYVAATKKWYLRNGQGQWEPDVRQQVLYLVQAACVTAATRSGDPALARTLCSASFIAAVERVCRFQPKLAGTREDVGLSPVKRRTAKDVGVE